MTKTHKKTFLAWQAACALAALSTTSMAYDDITRDAYEPSTLSNVNPGEYGAIRGEFLQIPYNSNSLTFDNGKFTIHDGVKAKVSMNSGTSQNMSATFIHAQNNGIVKLLGDVDIEGMEENMSTSVQAAGGLNLLLASHHGKLSVGEPGKTTKVYAFATIGDALSAKGESSLEVLSTKNQIVGNVDMLGVVGMGGPALIGKNSTLSMTLEGKDSFWFGSERSFSTGALLDNSKNPNQGLTELASLFLNPGNAEVVLKDGAQWSYVTNDGREYPHEINIFIATLKGVKVYPKTVSHLTLQNGGTVNLNDADLKAFWEKQGFADKHPLMKDPIKHDYAIIRKLDGDGGIIKLDINATNRDESDLIVVRKMTGNHFIEVADPNGLEGITETTPLLFAMTGGSGTFAAKTDKLATPVTNVELKIEKRDTLVRQAEDEAMINHVEAHDYFTSGLKPWYITTMTFKPSPNVTGVTNVGRSFMNQFMPYESLDTRYGYEVEASHESRPWVRLWGTTENYREEHFKTDTTRLAVGWSRPWGEFHRIGAMVEGMNAISRFDHQTYAKSKAHGLRVAVTDLYDRDDWYLDSKLEAGWLKQKATPSEKPELAFSWGQWAWGGSVEAGVRFKNENGFFVTPQVQVAARFVPSHSTNVAGVEVKQNSSLFATTREGLRLGMAYPDYSISAHVDFLQRWGKFGDAAYTDRYMTHQASWLGSKNWIEVGLNGHWRVTPKHQLALRVGGEIDKARSQAFFGMLEWSYRY